jgi:hypothetical protein
MKARIEQETMGNAERGFLGISLHPLSLSLPLFCPWLVGMHFSDNYGISHHLFIQTI